MITHYDEQQLNMLKANQALFVTNPALNAAIIPAMDPVMNTMAF